MSTSTDIRIAAPQRIEPSDRDTSRYRRLWRFSVLATSLVAIIPLFIMTAINFLHDREAYRTESQLAVHRILSTATRSLELTVEERRAALSLVLSERSYQDLASDTRLATTLQNLKKSFGGFVDLGLIDSDGNQSFYTGPYDLRAKNYKGQDWFHHVVLRGMYVSDVFMGYRNFPHFVIAFKGDKSGGDFYILRATIDTELITRRLYDLELDRQTDAFLVNNDGVLQTSSALHGKVLEKAALEIPPCSRNAEVLQESHVDGDLVTTGCAQLESTPFILVVTRRSSNAFAGWVRHRSVLLWFLGASVAVILTVVALGANRMISGLRETDARRAKAFHDLEYTNKLATVGRMAASVAHEINNPLAIISEDAGLLNDMATFTADFPYQEKVLNIVRSIQNSVERCSNVTHRLLGFARRMEVRKELIALDRLLEEVVSFQRTEILHRNINVQYHLPDVSPPIESDRGQLQQVFLNIISNALVAVADGGQIDVSLTQIDTGNVAVIISDNGRGIPEENLKHIFEPFYSTKGEFGTGLGLSITRDIVRKLGGTIDVQSKPDRGTSFIVTLPMKALDYKE